MKRRRKGAPQEPTAGAKPVEAQTEASRHSTTTLVVLLLVSAIVVFAVHFPALSARALSFDDQEYLVENQLVRNPGLTSAGRFLAEVLDPSTIGGYYQPLTMISLMIDYAMGGRVDYLMPFHLTSLLFHVANTLLVIVLLYGLFRQPWPAAIVGILFGLHPLTVETIPWVGERKTLLAAFFALWSLIAYVRYAQSGRLRFYLLTVVAYVLALLSKPTSTPLPLALLLLDYWPLRRFSGRAVIEKLPLLALGAVSALITFTSQQRTSGVELPGQYNPLNIPLILCHNIMFYPYKMLWPVNLSSHYALPAPFRLTDPWILAGVIGVVVLIPLLIWSLRRTRAFAAGWLVYFVLLLPTIQIIGFSIAIASDKYAYLPSIGFLIVLAYFLGEWLSKAAPPDRRRQRVLMMAGAAVLLFSAEAYGTRKYLTVWRDTETLYRHMIRLSPTSAALYANLGNVLREEGRLDESVEWSRKAAQCEPNSAPILNDLGLALHAAGKLDEAIACYQKALNLQPNYAQPCNNLGEIVFSQGRYQEALGYFEEATKRSPKMADAHYNRARTLVALGRKDEAVAAYQKVLRLHFHNAAAHNDLATLFAEKGRTQEAIDHFNEAIRFAPDYAPAHFNLAETLERLGRLPEAASEYRKVLDINPNDQDARRALDQMMKSDGHK